VPAFQAHGAPLPHPTAGVLTPASDNQFEGMLVGLQAGQ
jgi:hypothetical protein